VSNPHLALEGAPIFDELCLHGQNFATYFIGMSIYMNENDLLPKSSLFPLLYFPIDILSFQHN
jgi:hypothetical protein